MPSPAISPRGVLRSCGPVRALITAALLGAMVLALFSGCRMSNMIERFADDEKEAVAQRYFQLLIDRDFAAIERELDPSLRTPQLAEQLEAMHGLLPGRAPLARNLVGYYLNKTVGGPARYDLTYQIDYGTAWIVVATAWTEDGSGNRTLLTFRVQPLNEPLQKTHALTFERAHPRHYAFAVAGVGVFVFSVVTLVVCIRTRFPRRKWLWILFILLGVGQVALNWTTGQIGVMPMSLQLLSVGLSAPSLYAPWTLAISLPLGAILFWFKRRRLLRAAEPPPVPPPVAG